MTDAAHLAAAFHMRAAAGTDIHIRYRHDSYRARQLLFAAVVQLRQLRRRGPSYRHGRVLPYHPVGSAFHIGQLRIGERTGKIHRYILRADMKAHIVVAELSVYDAADDMLARVLLHVIQPAAAVHITLDHLSHTQRCCDRMHHYTVLFVHIQNARTARLPGPPAGLHPRDKMPWRPALRQNCRPWARSSSTVAQNCKQAPFS